MTRYVDDTASGELNSAGSAFILGRDPDSVLGPDVSYVQLAKTPPEDEQDGFWEVAPDLVAEIVAPSDTILYNMDVTATYLEAGVAVVLTIDPRRRNVSLHTAGGVSRTLQETDTQELPDILSGFSLRVAGIFRRVREARPESMG